MADEKLLNIESMPQIKLGFTQMGLDDVDVINKYIDDNNQLLPKTMISDGENDH